MKRLATLLMAVGGLALMLVAFTPNSSAAWAWGWRYNPCYGCYMHHYPYAYYPYWRCRQVREALGLQSSSLPPLYSWRLWFPLSNGLKPEVPFSIVFAENGQT